MSKLSPSSLLTLLITDQGAELRNGEGKVLGRLPEARAGATLRGGWAQALRELVPAGGEVQLLLHHGGLNVQCQDAPFLNRKEAQGVAERMALAEGAAAPLATTAVLDPDPGAEGGHVLWVASHPKQEMDDWVAALAGAGLKMVLATPLERALLRSLEDLEKLPRELAVLALEPGLGHLFFFRGRALLLVRSFKVAAAEDERDELVFEEVSRFLQFFKQKQRNLVVEQLLVVGVPDLSPGLRGRIQGSLRVQTRAVAPSLWTVLQRGLELEKLRHGLNLVPLDVQEAERRRVLRGMVWVAAAAMLGILGTVGLALHWKVSDLRRDVEQANANLALREAMANQVDSVVQARFPLLRVRAAEQRAADSALALARLSALLLSPPEGITLEKVEVLEVAGEKPAHAFTVVGTALTSRRFSVGPLAQYVATLAGTPGLRLAPLKEVSVSDRLEEGKERIEQQAVTRFTLEGKLP